MKLGNGPITIRGLSIQTVVMVGTITAAWGALRSDIKHLSDRQSELLTAIAEARVRSEANTIAIARLEEHVRRSPQPP